MEIIKLIQKNLRILFRNKISSLVIFFGPLLIIILAGLAFNNTGAYNIRIGVYSDAFSDTADQFVTTLEESFDTVIFNSERDCRRSIETQGFHACLVIPANLTIQSGERNIITFYVDDSRVNIVGFIEQQVYLAIEGASTDISSELTENLVDTTILARQELLNQKEKITALEQSLTSSISVTQNSATVLSSMDVSFDKNDLKLSQLTSAAQITIDTLRSLAQNATGSFKTSINTIDNLNMTNSQLDSEISSARSTITSLESSIGGEQSTDFNTLRNQAEASIASLESQLSQAQGSKSTLVTNVGTLQTNLQENLVTSKELGSSVDRVIERINTNQILEAESIVRPVSLERESIVSGSRLNFLFPNLIILIVMLVGLTMASLQSVQDKLSRARLRVSMTPISDTKVHIAAFLSMLIILVLQLVLLLTAIYFIFNIDILTSWLGILQILVAISIFFTIIGLIIGNVFNSEQTALLGAMSLGSIFFIASDLILPIESMPEYISQVIVRTPFVLSTDILRRAMFFNEPVGSIEFQIVLLYIIVIVSFVGIVSLVKGMLRKSTAKKTIIRKSSGKKR